METLDSIAIAFEAGSTMKCDHRPVNNKTKFVRSTDQGLFYQIKQMFSWGIFAVQLVRPADENSRPGHTCAAHVFNLQKQENILE